jgi:hypothetical protein
MKKFCGRDLPGPWHRSGNFHSKYESYVRRKERIFIERSVARGKLPAPHAHVQLATHHTSKCLDTIGYIFMRPTVRSTALPFMFLTPKSTRAILVTNPVLHDAMRQAALDRAVTRIEHVAAVMLGARYYPLDRMLVVRNGTSEVWNLTPARSMNADEFFFLAVGKLNAQVKQLTHENILKDPRCSNARLIWANRYRHVPIEIRNLILTSLTSTGRSSLESIGTELRECVFALACETALHIDIDCELIEKAQIFPSAGKAPDITATGTPKRRKADESQ